MPDSILFYAGAYVWGRRQTHKEVIDGRIVKKQGKINEPEQCRVFIKGHHEGYINWEAYEENRRIMSENALSLPRDESVGPARAGQGILAGLLRCGRCRRKLHVRYWGKSGTAARYLCKGDFDAGGTYCLGFGGSTIDRRFSEELLKIISPLGISASLEAVKKLSAKRDEKHAVLTRQLEQLEYEERRAFEQYDEVDPRNRLVADELERRWNEKLEKIENLKSVLAEVEYESRTLAEGEWEEILAMGE